MRSVMRVRLSVTRSKVTAPEFGGPLVLRHEMRRSGIWVVISESHSTGLPAILARQ